MKTYAYSVTVEGQSNQHIINTNDVSYAIHEFLRAHACGCEVVVCNGATGEVLCHNGDEPYTTDEMGLMVAGYLSIFGLPEGVEMSDEDEDSDLPTCGMCGGDVVDGVCNCCGRKVEPYVERVPDIGEVMVALAKQMADELGVEVIPLPGRDLDVSPCLLPIPKGLPS